MGEVLGARNPTTIRELLEAIRDRNEAYASFTPEGDDFHDAVAALDLLNSANYQRRDGFPSTRYALIRDPLHPHDDPRSVEITPSQSECEHLGEYTCLRCGIALGRGVDAEHA